MLTRQTAATAALEAIDEHGLDGLTLQHVADRLGVRTPSLYNHFRSRDELLFEVARLIWDEASFRITPAPGIDVADSLVELCLSVRRALLHHPGATPLLLELLVRHVFTERYEVWIGLLAKSGVAADRLLVVIQGLEALTHGGALFEAAAINQGAAPFPDVDGSRFPRLADALATAPTPDDQFERVVRAFLRGALDVDGVTEEGASPDAHRPRLRTPAASPAIKASSGPSKTSI